MCKIVLIYSTNGAHKVYCKFANFLEKKSIQNFSVCLHWKRFFSRVGNKRCFFKNHTTPWQEMTYIVFTTRNNPSAFIQAYKCRQQKAYRKMLWRTRDVIYSTEHHQREDIARYCSAHFGDTINQERKLQDATRNRKVVKIRDSICQTWQEQRYKYNVTLLVKLHLLLIRFFSFCLLSPKKDDKTFPEIVIPSRDVQTLSFGLWQFLPTCSLEHHQLQGHSYKC